MRRLTVGSLYDRADIYDLFENEDRYQAYKKHWKTIFEGKAVKTMLDVSIGSGSVTIPVTDLGIKLSGSDLSETMIEKCKKKTKKNIDLRRSDFRDLSCWTNQKFDLVASSGNSLAYVNNDEVMLALEQMDSHVNDGGYLYFDSRNWEKILTDHQRFYFYDPLFDGGNRVNVMQVWDYNEDDSITFNISYTFEKDNHIFQKEIFEEHYYPISKELLVDKLLSLGYKNIELRTFPSYFPMTEFEKVEWYSVIARKQKCESMSCLQ